MTRVIVLGSPRGWHAEDLRRAARGHLDLAFAAFSGLRSEVTPTGTRVASGGAELTAADALLVRAMPPGALEQVVFRMDALAVARDAGVAVVNPPKAIEVAVDKYLAGVRLKAAGLDTPHTFACQTAEEADEAFARLGGRAVLKPVFGGEGRGVTLLEDPAMAARAFALLQRLGAVILLQEFLPPDAVRGACDYRLLVVGDRVLGMRRRHATDWRTNISRGATAEPLELTPALAELALRSATAVGAPLAGVDILPAAGGRFVVLEVNAAPGWRALRGVTGVDVAGLVLGLLAAEAGA